MTWVAVQILRHPILSLRQLSVFSRRCVAIPSPAASASSRGPAGTCIGSRSSAGAATGQWLLRIPNPTARRQVPQEVMCDIVKEDFPKLSLGSGIRYYFTWASKIEAYLAKNDLSETITSDSNCSLAQKAKALIYMRRHLGGDFKNEFLFEQDPLVLWQSLKDRFDQLKAVDLIQAKYDWEHLSFSDFDSVAEYNSALQDIADLFKACDKEISEQDLIEKTLYTFPPSDYILREMYMKKNYGTYSELISALLLAEKQDQKLLENYYARPTRRFD